ncbi:hypothetical protein IEU95_09330 [Hoyosella rhizosphaerae]|uniref:Uncharacterized protein n=1 Tax=Hoyosella rhizosphaerae TaxID=1755582 RepID=A0A916TZP4_9ACTN|nr:hypothetical protein [Hoyosella rhizosphaerae]MBN4927034.1 hypothetical protein [Hoyosella rhizosphaerae]GGC54549.1 hypothetical protein GCM10011410_03690 [Hoyosella rhizosphaerae]
MDMPELAMLDTMGMILPIWLEFFFQEQVDLINSLTVPYGSAPIADVDFGLDYDLDNLESASII